MGNITNGGRLNALQAVGTLKRCIRARPKPRVPSRRPARSPHMINTYTDGGVLYPKVRCLSLGGFRIWTPEDAECEQDGDIHFTHSEKEGGGTMQWAAMPGQRCTSTRVETAAALNSLIKNRALHIGTDSPAMLSKAMKLKKAAADWISHAEQHWYPDVTPSVSRGDCRRMVICGVSCGRPAS